MKKEYRIFTISIGLCFILTSILLWSFQPVMANITWQENFDDLSAWTIHNGDFDLIDGMAVATGTDPIQWTGPWSDPPLTSFMTRPSNAVMGNWTFDVRLDNSTYTAVFFMVHDAGTFSNTVNDSFPMLGVEFLESQMTLVRYSFYLGLPSVTEIASHSVATDYGSYRISVLRHDADHFKAYLNGTSVIDTTTLAPDETFNYFGFLGDEGSAIDNIVVSEFAPTTTTPPTTTTEPTEPPPLPDIPMVLVAIGGAVVVFIIVLVVWKLRT